MITHTHTPSDRAVGRRLGLILRTSFFNRERERAYIRAFCARALFNLPRAVVYQREQRSDIYIYIYISAPFIKESGITPCERVMSVKRF